MLYSHRELSNKAKAFDGVILFLSQKLEEKVKYGSFLNTRICIYLYSPI